MTKLLVYALSVVLAFVLGVESCYHCPYMQKVFGSPCVTKGCSTCGQCRCGKTCKCCKDCMCEMDECDSHNLPDLK